MQIEYIAQPDKRLGTILLENLHGAEVPKRVVIVTAFASLQTIMRLKPTITDLCHSRCDVSIVLGIDMGGTSKEVLREVSVWPICVTIVKNRLPGVTFHPKVYLVEWVDKAEIIIGSHNLTEGGFYRNYEGSARVRYDFPDDQLAFIQGCKELERFLSPSGDVAYDLDETYLQRLLVRSDIPSEHEARERARKQIFAVTSVNDQDAESPFGTENIPPPPPLPAEILERLMAARAALRKEKKAKSAIAEKKEAQPAAKEEGAPVEHEEQIAPAAFYMTLPTLQGENIPGESRIPLAAIEMAQEFWGWPDHYSRTESPRSGHDRVYHEWKPTWRIWSVSDPASIQIVAVRMYMYDNSSDFRFYARPLVNAKGDLGDVVKITRVSEPGVEFECVLAKQGTPEYEQWIQFCTVAVCNSPRLLGFG